MAFRAAEFNGDADEPRAEQPSHGGERGLRRRSRAWMAGFFSALDAEMPGAAGAGGRRS